MKWFHFIEREKGGKEIQTGLEITSLNQNGEEEEITG